jgi:hypothetical protein
MQIASRDWLVYCQDCGEYTALNRFIPQRGHFQGEHSLVLNTYLMSDLLLGKFLLHHHYHTIVAIPNLTDEYMNVIRSKDRFMDSLIDQIVSERVQAERDKEESLHGVRSEGYAAVLALRKLFTEKVKEMEQNVTEDPEQAKMRLGRVLGIEWCIAQIDNLLEMGRVRNKHQN